MLAAHGLSARVLSKWASRHSGEPFCSFGSMCERFRRRFPAAGLSEVSFKALLRSKEVT